MPFYIHVLRLSFNVTVGTLRTLWNSSEERIKKGDINAESSSQFNTHFGYSSNRYGACSNRSRNESGQGSRGYSLRDEKQGFETISDSRESEVELASLDCLLHHALSTRGISCERSKETISNLYRSQRYSRDA